MPCSQVVILLHGYCVTSLFACLKTLLAISYKFVTIQCEKIKVRLTWRTGYTIYESTIIGILYNITNNLIFGLTAVRVSTVNVQPPHISTVCTSEWRYWSKSIADSCQQRFGAPSPTIGSIGRQPQGILNVHNFTRRGNDGTVQVWTLLVHS